MGDSLSWILVVDDKEENRFLLREHLDILDVNIDEAESGMVCLEKLQQKSYMLVILDVQMPKMDGYTVLAKMREDKRTEDIPVIFVSAIFNSEEHILKGIESGAIDFMAKPINSAILTSKVSNYIRFYERQIKLDVLVKSLENMNQRLRENERKFKKITQSASDAIILLDQDLRIRFWNMASQKIFGYNKFEVISEEFIDFLFSEKSHEEINKQFSSLKDTSAAFQSSIRLYGKNKVGLEFPVELSLALFNTAEKTLNYTVIIRDISHRVKIEKEALVAKELRESNKVMKEFMDNVSHELRTPMNAIMGISNMLVKYNSDNLSQKQREGLQIINESGTRLLEMINDVLDLSRIEARKETVRPEKFSLDQFLASINSIVISLIGNKGLKFQIRKSLNVPEFVKTDSKKLQQILINLLSNSVKFTTTGKIQLFIHLIEGKLYFEVLDTGVGIEEENLELVFQRFQQIDNTASKEYKGTGLGLNIVRKLVELMQGEIKAESDIGKGTTMKFYIPVVIAESDRENGIKPIHREDILWTPKLEINSKLVLIIDYKNDNHFLFSNLLKEAEYIVVSCYESNKAANLVKLILPDLIIMNMEMPKIHGSTVLNQLEKIESVVRIPIIALTSVEKMKLISTNLNIHLLKNLINERILIDTIQKINIKREDADICEYLALHENESHLKNILPPGSIAFQNDSYEFAMLAICRRRIKNLILDGFSMQGENIKLVRELGQEGCNSPQRIFIISNQPFKSMIQDLKKLPHYKLIPLSEIQSDISMEKLLSD